MRSYLPPEVPESVVITNPRNRTPYPHREWDFQSRVNYAFRGLPANFRPIWKICLWKGTPVAHVRSIAPDWFDMVLDEFPVVPVEGPLPEAEFYDDWYLGREGLPPGDPGLYSVRPGAYAFASIEDAQEWDSRFPNFVRNSPYSPISLYDLFHGVAANSNHYAIRRRMLAKLAKGTHRYEGYGVDSHFMRLFAGFAAKREPVPKGYPSFYANSYWDVSNWIEEAPGPVPEGKHRYRWSNRSRPSEVGVYGQATLSWEPSKRAIRDETMRFNKYSGPHILAYPHARDSWTSDSPITPGLRYSVGRVHVHGLVDQYRTKLRPYRGRRAHWMSNNPYGLSPRDSNRGRYLWYHHHFGDRYLTDRES
jgi:hypothetical protein